MTSNRNGFALPIQPHEQIGARGHFGKHMPRDPFIVLDETCNLGPAHDPGSVRARSAQLVLLLHAPVENNVKSGCSK